MTKFFNTTKNQAFSTLWSVNFLLKRENMHIPMPNTSENSPQHKRTASWVSSVPQRDANKFTSEEYYVLFYFSKVSLQGSLPQGEM